MSIVLLCNAKGSPGTTTAALALATAWPEDEAVLLAECDISGGDLGAHYGLRGAPGIATLSMYIRRGVDINDLNDHIQSLPHEVGLLVGVAGTQQGVALAPAWSHIAQLLNSYKGVVILDIGRIHADITCMTDLINIADLILLVAKPGVASVIHLRSAIEVLNTFNPTVKLLLIGEKPYGSVEIEEATGIEVAGVIAHDTHAAEGIELGLPLSLRSKLVRSAKNLADNLVGQLRSSAQRLADNIDHDTEKQPIETTEGETTYFRNTTPTILLDNKRYRSVVSFNYQGGST